MLENYCDGELTTVSFSHSVPRACERRADTRHLTVLRVAKLMTPRNEELCLVRNVSAGGLMAHVYSSLTVGDIVSIEFKTGDPIPGTILWLNDNMAGIEFDQKIDILKLLSTEDDASTLRRARAPRIGVGIKGSVRIGTKVSSVLLRDISQGGAKLVVKEIFDIGEEVALTVRGLPTLAGSIRWQDHPHIGLEFHTALPFNILAQWVPKIGALTVIDPSPSAP